MYMYVHRYICITCIICIYTFHSEESHTVGRHLPRTMFFFFAWPRQEVPPPTSPVESPHDRHGTSRVFEGLAMDFDRFAPAGLRRGVVDITLW